MKASAGDFFFAGAAILPWFLLHADEPALAAIAFLALVIAGAVAGIVDPAAPHRGARRPRR